MKHKYFLSTYNISINAFYTALYLLFAFVPQLGFITIPGVAATIVPIVVGFHVYHLGLTGAIFSGFAFGFSSLIASYVIGDITGLFYHFDIAVLPRILVAFTAYLFFKWTPKKLWLFVLGLFFTTLSNTLWVTLFIFLHKQILLWIDSFDKVFMEHTFSSIYIWISLIWINSVFELVLSIFVAIPLYPLAKHLFTKYQITNQITW